MGGRIFNGISHHMNYGAVFYFGSYRTMLSKQRGIPKPMTDVVPNFTAVACNPDDVHQWLALSAKTAVGLPSLWRFEKLMTQEFLPHYERLKMLLRILHAPLEFFEVVGLQQRPFHSASVFIHADIVDGGKRADIVDGLLRGFYACSITRGRVYLTNAGFAVHHQIGFGRGIRLLAVASLGEAHGIHIAVFARRVAGF